MREKAEPVSPLVGEIEVEKVILGDEVQLYPIEGVVAYLDSPLLDYHGDVPVFFSNPVPVIGCTGDVIGSVNLEVREHGSLRGVFARGTVDYHTLERFEIEQGRLYYLQPLGHLICEDSLSPPSKQCDFYGVRPQVVEAHVHCINLTNERPSDFRISSVNFKWHPHE